MGEGLRRLGSLILVLSASGSCETQQCTEIGCSDGASLTARTAGGTLPDGVYRLNLTVDGRTHACEFDAPGDLPSEPGRLGTASCDSGFQIDVLPEVVCTEQRSGDAVSQSCTPVPNHWYFSATLPGTPSSFTLAVERDGTELLNEQRALSYRDEYPNGPECGPVCRQASAELMLAD